MTQQYPPQQPPYGQPGPPPYGYQPPPVPNKRRKWPWVVGGVLLLLVLLSAISGRGATTPPTSTGPTWATSSPTAGAPATRAEDAATANADGSTIVYEVIGKGSGSVTYMKEGFAQEQQTSAKLPFKKELQFKDKVGSFAPISLVAQHMSGSGDITCRITVDGQVVAENTSSGQYAVVTCNGNG